MLLFLFAMIQIELVWANLWLARLITHLRSRCEPDNTIFSWKDVIAPTISLNIQQLGLLIRFAFSANQSKFAYNKAKGLFYVSVLIYKY